MDPQQHSQYRTTVGQLIWVSLDRPDLMFAAKPRSSRLQGSAAQISRVSNTLCATSKEHKYKIFIGKGLADYLPKVNGTVTLPQHNIPLELKGYTDSDRAGDKLHVAVLLDTCVHYSTARFLRQQSSSYNDFIKCRSRFYGAILRDG